MDGPSSTPSFLLDRRRQSADSATQLPAMRSNAQRAVNSAVNLGGRVRLLEQPLGWQERLGTMEWRRRVWHMSPGLLPFLLWPFPHRDPISPMLQLLMSVTIIGLAMRIYLQYRLIQRSDERIPRRTGAVLGYACSILLTLLLLPAHAEVGLGVLGILAFGDGAATLGGLLFGGRRLPWNPQKSWSGLLSFFSVGTVMTALIYWGESNNLEAQTPGVAFGTALICASIPTALAALAESVQSRIDDNIRVGIVAVIGMVSVHAVICGL